MYPASKHINLGFLTAVLIGFFVLNAQLLCAQIGPESNHQTNSCNHSLQGDISQCHIKNRFLCQCFEKNDSLCFSSFDLQTNRYAFPIQAIHPLKYVNKNHLQAQSLQLTIDTGNVFNNRLYIAWADQKNGENNWDVFLVYSDDMGLHWTEPILVTYHPNHKNQWCPKLNINTVTGQLSILYFDQQNYAKQKYCDVYLAQSNNGGLKFNYYQLNVRPLKLKGKALSNGFVQKQNIASWTNPANKYCEQILLSDIEKKQQYKIENFNSMQIQSSFVYKQQLTIDFVCTEDLYITAELSKPIEPQFQNKLIKGKTFRKGNNQLLIDMTLLKALKGNYTLTLYYKGINKFIWITEE